MRIAINSLGVDGGGGRTYFDHFLPALLQADRESEYLVLVRSSSMSSLPASSPQMRYIPVEDSTGIVGRFQREQFWLPRWLKREKVDLLFSPADSTSLLAPCPVVLAMRNMNLYVPRDKGWSFSFRLKFGALSRFARLSSKIARKIIFVSHFSKELIAKQLGIAPEKQKVVYHGVSPQFFEQKNSIPESLAWVRSRTPYLLSVSSIYRYKNFVRLIEAFALYRKKATENYHLIIAGKPYDKPYYEQMKKAIERHQLESYVYLANEVAYADLPILYQNAKLFIFASYLETFGHPLVEAMAGGVPILAGDIENSREIAGEAALYFNPYDVNKLVDSLGAALEQTGIRENLILKGKEQVKQFSWNRCARETADVFREALGKLEVAQTGSSSSAGSRFS